MEKVFIGKIVSTHGIKGELRILSDFPYKDKVFQIGNVLLIEDREYIIQSYRVHKNYDMVTLNSYQDINEVLFLLKKDVYVRREDLLLGDNEVLDSELITYKVFSNLEKEGIIKEIFYASPTNKVVRVFIDREYLIPYSLLKIDKKNRSVTVEIIDGM